MIPQAGDRIVRRRDVEGAATPRTGLHAWLVPRIAWDSLGTFAARTSSHEISVTFDDGPHPVVTPRLLDMLADHHHHATFYVMTDRATRHPEIVRRIAAEGHEVGLHGWDHRSILPHGAPVIGRIRTARDAIERIIGGPVTSYRPPYGKHSPRQARAIARIGLELTLWSGDAQDWKDAPAADVAERAWQAVKPGAILLLHDDRADPETLQPGESLPTFDRVDVLERLLQRMAENQYTSLSVRDLLRRHPRLRSFAPERAR